MEGCQVRGARASRGVVRGTCCEPCLLAWCTGCVASALTLQHASELFLPSSPEQRKV